MRHQDVGITDPILAATAVWTTPPTGRASVGPVYYGIEVSCMTIDGTSATIGLGFFDKPGLATPSIASYCMNCYDADRGAPPPSADWNVYGNYGRLTSPTTFYLNFDEENRTWAWYINGQAVRAETSRLLAPGRRLSVGVRLDTATEMAHPMWHHDVRLRRKVLGPQHFQPNDARWAQTETDQGILTLLPTGTVYIQDRLPAVAHRFAPVTAARARGGGGGPVAHLPNSGLFVVAQGPSLLSIDTAQARISALKQLTSTVTAMIVEADSVIVATAAGQITRLSLDGRELDRQQLPDGRWATALAFHGAAGLVGTDDGKLYALHIGDTLTVTPVLDLGAAVRCIAYQNGSWVVGIDLVDPDGPGGKIQRIREKADHSFESDTAIGIESAPVGMVSVAQNGLLLALASGEIYRFLISPLGLESAGRLTVLPEVITATGSDESWMYVAGEQGSVWTLHLGLDGTVGPAEHGLTGMLSSAIAAGKSNLIVTSDTGVIASFAVVEGRLGDKRFDSTDVGLVTDIAAENGTAAMLVGNRALQFIPADNVSGAVDDNLTLKRYATAFRGHEDTAILLNGSDGLDIYDLVRRSFVSHLALSGVSRDAVLLGNIAYIAAGISGLHVVDISNATQPVLVMTLQTKMVVATATVFGNLLLVGHQAGDITAFDVSEPRMPRSLGIVSHTQDILRFSNGRDAVFGLSANGTVYELGALDSIPVSLPLLEGTTHVSRFGAGIQVTADGLYVASASDGIQRMSSAAVKEIVNLGLPVAGPVMALTEVEQTMFAAAGTNGLVWWPASASKSLFLPFLVNDRSPIR